MMKFKVQTKTLFTLVSISIAGLIAFGYLSFTSYKKDKLAFIYDQILGQTHSFAQMVNLRMEKHELLLGSVITQLSEDQLDLGQATKSYLEEQPSLSVLGIEVQGPGSAQKNLLLNQLNQEVSWSKVEGLTNGIHAMDLKSSLFIYKRPLSNKEGFAFVIFKDLELAQTLNSSEMRSSAIMVGQEIMTLSQWQNFGQLISEARAGLPDLKKVPFGLSEMNLAGENYLVAYAATKGNGTILSFHKSKSLMLVQEVFVKQLGAFLSLMGFISLLIGSYASNWLTRCLSQLELATKKIEKEDFDFDLNIKSGDEFEVLGNAFTSMGDKIKNLLSELRRYNTQLEELVAERTKELQELTNIQKTMLNALGQGFVMVDRNKKVGKVYSKVAVDMFDGKPDEAGPLDILSVNESDKPQMDEFMDHAFNENVDFDTFAMLAPGQRTNTKSQKIFLEYAPIRNEETNVIDYFLVIGTDRTEEIESKEKFEREWKFSQMILAMAKNRERLCKVVTDSFRMLDESFKLLDKGVSSYLDIQRRVHTIKGSFSFFYIDQVTKVAHDIETQMEELIKGGKTSPEVHTYLTNLKNALHSAVNEFDEIIRYNQHTSGRFIDQQGINAFASRLGNAPELQEAFRDLIYKVDIHSEFVTYPRFVKEIGDKLGKEVSFYLESERATYPEGPWTEILPELVHVVRNSIDHGIETPAERESVGKKSMGEIRFSFSMVQHNGANELFISLMDDGRGIDVEKLSKKFPDVIDFDSAVKKIALGGASSNDTVSEYSGRGVGVSAVVQKTLSLGGRWEIRSAKGMGMILMLWIPLKNQKLSLRAA